MNNTLGDNMKTSVNVENSSSIKSYEYNDETMVLTIVFKAGSRYDYYSVDSATVSEFHGAESKGKFLATRIKDVFHAEKIEEGVKGGRANLPKPYKMYGSEVKAAWPFPTGQKP